MRRPMTNSNEGHIDEAVRESEAYLEAHPELVKVLDDVFMALRSIEDLVPQDLDRLFSGHFFPISEAEVAAETSMHLVMRGFYREGYVTLRTILELGLLSVFWDKDNDAHISIQDWLKSKQDTPFFKTTVMRGVLSIPHVETFCAVVNFKECVDRTYDTLSDYVHIRGAAYSYRGLWRSNVPRFSEKVLLRWSKMLTRVVQIVGIAHILRYPVALQFTPIDEKFGLNGPVGTFLTPWQSESLKAFMPENCREHLQEISDCDQDAVSMAKWVNDRPDLTEDEWEEQIEEQGRRYIEDNGFLSWHRLFDQPLPGRTEEGLAKHKAMSDRLAQWAQENGLYERGKFPPANEISS